MFKCGVIQSPTASTPCGTTPRQHSINYNTWNNNDDKATHSSKHKPSITLPAILCNKPVATLVDECTINDTQCEPNHNISIDELNEWNDCCSRVMNRSMNNNQFHSTHITPTKSCHTTPMKHTNKYHILRSQYNSMSIATDNDIINRYIPSPIKPHSIRRYKLNKSSTHKIHRAIRKLRRTVKSVQFVPVQYYHDTMLQLDIYSNNSYVIKQNQTQLNDLFDTILTFTPSNNNQQYMNRLSHRDILLLHSTPKHQDVSIKVDQMSDNQLTSTTQLTREVLPIQRNSITDKITMYESYVNKQSITPTRQRGSSCTQHNTNTQLSDISHNHNRTRQRSSSVSNTKLQLTDEQHKLN